MRWERWCVRRLVAMIACTENPRWITGSRSCQSLLSLKTHIVFWLRKVIQPNLVGNISYKPGSRITLIFQVLPKTGTYLAGNNVNSFSLGAYRIPQVNSSISPFSPTFLWAADAIIFLAPHLLPSLFCLLTHLHSEPTRWIGSPSSPASTVPPQTARLICLQDVSDLWYDPIRDAWP